MKIRIMGTRAETDDAVKVLRLAFDVLEVSDFRPNRGDSRLGRVYVEANPPADPLPGT
ncbi:hypothetical protein [Amycolatopsis sp. lyj-346]|uniref:hypothetical protein n=1 Tax=Amycolatopsis sp. lyj-346 TaxID=2789289 RepID=UPI00397A01EF